ncbi:dolichyl-diphosphooligosaccharide-protein glycotransferase [Saccharomyces paradoxus]|uniref:Dolichyl-diphosphooligosaccharide-protein glycotransferase n=1 Tax=Saccharomyces paradoxus TaxID=27291 RepID=A0A8B8UXG8_SACPA|nr:Swp1 [Saccharomyces paradoxus]QHS75420.1 Swp1 [Saccharomyces paradoxus]
MQFFKTLVILVSCISVALAYVAQDVHVSFPSTKGKTSVMIGKVQPKQGTDGTAPTTIAVDNPNEVIQVNFAIDSANKPFQNTLLVGLPNKNLEMTFEPEIKDNGKLSMYNYKIDLAKLDAALLQEASRSVEPIKATLILASSTAKPKENLFREILQLDLNFNVDHSDSSLVDKFSIKPEIHHIFHTEPKRVAKPIAVIFVAIIVITILSLIVTWLNSCAAAFNNIPTGINAVYFLGFIATIVGFEVIFARYYLGTSIFETLFSSLYLGAPGLLTSTKFLRSFGQTI